MSWYNSVKHLASRILVVKIKKTLTIVSFFAWLVKVEFRLNCKTDKEGCPDISTDQGAKIINSVHFTQNGPGVVFDPVLSEPPNFTNFAAQENPSSAS